MARKGKKKAIEPPPPATATAADYDTEEESIEDASSTEGQSSGDIPPIIDKDGSDDAAAATDNAEESKQTGGSNKARKKKGGNANEPSVSPIAFMDTFYQLSSDASPSSAMERSVAARDLLHHCFLTSDGVNLKDAAYALTRLMNGLCSGRAASRQGFASCLSSFLKLAYSGSSIYDILKEDDYAAKLMEEDDTLNSAMIVRKKLLATTVCLAEETPSGNSGKGKNRFAGKVKGMEERDHAFGRLFGILAVVRSGVLGSEDFPSEVVGGYTKDLVELYHYKKWMREPSSHAIIELLSTLGSAKASLDLFVKIVNDVITPALLLPSAGKDSKKDRTKLLEQLTPEQISVVLHLQSLQSDGEKMEFAYPLDEPIVTASSVPTLAAALASTSHVVPPRSHLCWDTLWMYLTEEKVVGDGTAARRELKPNDQFPLIIARLVEHVVVDSLLGKGEGTTPTNERRSLALQIVCSLCGSSDLKITLPPDLIGAVLCPDVVTRVFVNVLCANGGSLGKKKKAKEDADGMVEHLEHHLKPMTNQALLNLVNNCCDGNDDVSRRMAFTKAFLLTDPRFDGKTKTRTVSSLLMLDESMIAEEDKESEAKRGALWNLYLSFLEEKIVSSASLHSATVYIELMFKLAKHGLAISADEGRRVVRFFMSGAFFDCSELVDPSLSVKSSSKKKKGKAKKVTSNASPPELSSAIRIKEILQANEMLSVSHPARALMAARFYSLLSDFISNINAQNRGGKEKDKSIYAGKGSRPESIYRSLSEICGIFSLLESSGAKRFGLPSSSEMEVDESSNATDPMEASRKAMMKVQNIANEALVKECDGSGDDDMLRAKAVFATGCASLMISLFLQLNSCGNSDPATDDEAEDETNEVAETVHEFISDLTECVDGFCRVIDGESTFRMNDDEGNPLAEMAGLLVNILSSTVGGEESGKNPIQASASKLTRETVKLSWSGIISLITSLNGKNATLKSLVDEDVMSILVESVCGGKSMGDENQEDDDSIEESISSVEELGDSAVFVNASEAGVDLEEAKEVTPTKTRNDSDEDSSEDSDNGDDGDEDIELDPTRLENLLLEDSDAEMSDSGGILEHHEGADKALAQLIKLKQEARKKSQVERERIDLCNRMRCAMLLDTLFSASVFKSGWLPIEAVLGSIVPILRSRKIIEKSIRASSSANSKKSLSERNSLLDRLTGLVKEKISKFRSNGNIDEAEELALTAVSDINKELSRSLNVADCSCCSVALITAARCIPNVEDNDDVKGIFADSVRDWSSRKATKIHACVFENLIQRMPSFSSCVLIEPLVVAARDAHSPFLKCESIKLLSSLYKNDGTNAGELLSKKASGLMKGHCGAVTGALKDALSDPSLQKAKHRDEVLTATKHIMSYIKAQDEGILTDSELCGLQGSVKEVGNACNGKGMKQMCNKLSETIDTLARKESDGETPKRSKSPKTPKRSSKKQKKAKK